MTFSLHQGVVVMSSQIMHAHLSNKHTLAHILGACTSIFSSRVIFIIYPPPKKNLLCQEPPSCEYTTTECGVNSQLLAVIYQSSPMGNY